MKHFLEAVEMLTLNPESFEVSASGRVDAYGVRAPSPTVTVTVLSLEIWSSGKSRQRVEEGCITRPGNLERTFPPDNRQPLDDK